MLHGVLAAIIRRLARLTYSNEWAILKAEVTELSVSTRRDRRFEQLQAVYQVLVLAEDRRFFSHSGFDFRAVLRALLSLIRGRQVQGASTVTQQLVRTLTKNYSRTIGRKYKEILLSELLDAEFSKEDQLRSYLKVAYFGWRMNGILQACNRLNIQVPITDVSACSIIARLKYPEPQHPSETLRINIENRTQYLLRLLQAQRKMLI